MNGAINGAILENYVVSEIMKSYSNNGLEALCHYYRDKDNKEIDIVIESDGELHPIEIKKTASPSAELADSFKVLDKAKLNRGVGAVICTKRELSAIDRSTMIVPVWSL
jgi:predicted AAA+ superfamily ATPase